MVFFCLQRENYWVTHWTRGFLPFSDLNWSKSDFSTNGVRTTWTAFIVRIALEITKKSDLWTAAASWTVRMKYFNNIPLRIMNWHTKSSLEFQFSAFLKLWCDIWIVAVQHSFRAVDNICVLLTVPNIISEFESKKLDRGQNGPFRNNSKSQPLR